MRKVVIIFGPQATGKTRNAEALRKHYGMDRVYDLEGHPAKGKKFYPGDLVLLTTATQDFRECASLIVGGHTESGVAVSCIAIDHALEAINIIR